jgi:hypothetical protein
MTPWGVSFSRRARGGKAAGGEPAAGGAPAAAGDDEMPVVVEQRDGLLLIRTSPASSPGPEEVAELARTLAAADVGLPIATVVVGVGDEASPALWRRLNETLDILQADGVTTVRLVLPGAGSGNTQRPALGRQIADAWEIEVIAPVGPALIVPGGSLFAPDHLAPLRGWQLFAPGTDPRPLGPRHPEPAWQEALGRLPDRTASGCVVEQIPAGVLVRSPRARPPQPGDVCFAVPADPGQPLVLVGVPGPADSPDVPSDDLGALLAALPQEVRSQARLAPGNHKDLLPAAQDIANAFGIEVELLTGVPLDSGASPDARPVLIGRDGTPTWRPFAEAVVCHPAASADGEPDPGPSLLRWAAPVPGPGGDGQGTVHLSERWQVSVVRAGLHLLPAGRSRPPDAWQVTADQLAILLGLPGEPMDDSLFPALSQLLFDLDPALREYVVVQVLGRLADGGSRLHRIAVQYGVRVAWLTAPAVPPVVPAATALAGSAPSPAVPASALPNAAASGLPHPGRAGGRKRPRPR